MKDDLPDEVIIHETVLRDGIQNEETIVSLEKKLQLIDRLVGCGIKRIEISSFVNPRLVPQMADAEELWNRIERKEGIVYSALVLGKKSLNRAIVCGVPHVGIFVSASETHSRKNSNRSISEAKEEAFNLIKRAKSSDMKVRAGVMNAFGCAYEGDVSPEKVMDLVRDFMETDPDEICLADTSGMANPLQMHTMLSRLREITEEKPISLHLHNTRGLGLANVWEALKQGVTIFDTSMGGLGGCPFIPGARGNIATEDTVHMLCEIGIETGIDIEALIEVSLYFEKYMGKEFPAMIPHLKHHKSNSF
ncbi:MAG: hydroxymethylglutaryl-CoA lyase [Deltaproteobacteria bacterium]|nr:hydroxymethylglutaryl-CoA lyase [Deltaproteobacteria bacterium]